MNGVNLEYKFHMYTSTEKSITIHDIDTNAEMRAVEDLQREVWGIPDLEVVPLSEIVAVKTAGGLLIGAFDEDELVGFVYGFVSLEDGQLSHHSHMLAVKPGYRGSSIGHRLKLAQRERVLAQGITTMSWTFDPLQSVNAYLNFNKLGVICNRYFYDFYGDDAASFLHQNGTDRLWITWPLATKRVRERIEKPSIARAFENVNALVEINGTNIPHVNDPDKVLSNDSALIEIPSDINSLELEDRQLAAEWRQATRRAFTAAIDAGYTITEFERRKRGGKPVGTYLLTRQNGLVD